jgi:hypothetical protein
MAYRRWIGRRSELKVGKPNEGHGFASSPNQLKKVTQFSEHSHGILLLP